MSRIFEKQAPTGLVEARLTVTEETLTWELRPFGKKSLETIRSLKIRRENQVKKAIADALAEGLTERV